MTSEQKALKAILAKAEELELDIDAYVKPRMQHGATNATKIKLKQRLLGIILAARNELEGK